MANSLTRSRSCGFISKPTELSLDEVVGSSPITSIEDEGFEKVFLAAMTVVQAGVERVLNAKKNSVVDLTPAVADQIQAVEPKTEKKGVLPVGMRDFFN